MCTIVNYLVVIRLCQETRAIQKRKVQYYIHFYMQLQLLIWMSNSYPTLYNRRQPSSQSMPYSASSQARDPTPFFQDPKTSASLIRMFLLFSTCISFPSVAGKGLRAQISSKGVIKGLFILVGLPVLLLLPAPSICSVGPNRSLDSVRTTSPLLSIALGNALPPLLNPSPTPAAGGLSK